MLSLKVVENEWLVIGGARIKLDRGCQVYIDAPREIEVVRGGYLQKKLIREVYEILNENGSNRGASQQEREALSFVCLRYDMAELSRRLGDFVYDKGNPHIKRILRKLNAA